MKTYSDSWDDLNVKLGSGEEEGILTLTLNNPEMSNAITIPMIRSLTEVLQMADLDPKVRVIILTGEGKTFCAGGDIKAMESKGGMFAGPPHELWQRYLKGIQEIPKTIEPLQTPLIALVNGPAVGAGCDLACMCDLRIGGPKAKFGETFAKLGLVPGDGGTFFLQRVVGYAKALEMFLTGNFYSRSEACEMGLLNIDFDTLQEAQSYTIELARKIQQSSPIALTMTKKALKMGHKGNYLDQLELLAAYQGIAQRTDDHFEGLKAFKEKRNPQFPGFTEKIDRV